MVIAPQGIASESYGDSYSIAKWHLPTLSRAGLPSQHTLYLLTVRILHDCGDLG